MHIGPTIASIRAWAAEQAARIAAEITDAQVRYGDLEARAWGMGRPVHFDLNWTQGVIDGTSSRAWALPQEPREEMTRHGLTYDRTTR